MNEPIEVLPARHRHGTRPLLIASFGLLVVVAIVVVRLTTNMVDPGVAEGAAGDFRDATYFPARALLDGVNPYDPAAYLDFDPAIGQYFPVYGPHHLLLHLPFAVLPLDAAMAVYAGLTLSLTLALAWVGLGLAGFSRPAPVVLGTAALLLASNPGRANFVDLQPTILIVFGAYLALAPRSRPWVGGLGVALAFLKPQFGIPLVIILWFTGRTGPAWRGIAIATIATAPIAARLIAIEGGIGGVVDSIRDNLQFASDTDPSSLQIDLARSFGIGSIPVILLIASLLLGAAVLSLRSRPGLTSESGLTITLSTVLLVFFHVNYDLLLLTWPLLASAAVVRRGSRDRLHLTVLALLLALFFNPLTSSFAVHNLGSSEVLRATSALTLIAVLGLSVLLHRREQPVPGREQAATSGVDQIRHRTSH